MVLLASSFDQSKYLRAEDLTEEKAFRIKTVTVEMVGQGADQGQKPVVWFANSKKGLTLNRTNNRTIRGAFGDDMEQWEGKVIVVYPTHAEFRGKIVGALRVRIPPPKEAEPKTAPPAPQEALDQFAQSAKPAKPKKKTPTPAPEPELSVDLDDEIDF